jgi:hypothetical protein
VRDSRRCKGHPITRYTAWVRAYDDDGKERRQAAALQLGSQPQRCATPGSGPPAGAAGRRSARAHSACNPGLYAKDWLGTCPAER